MKDHEIAQFVDRLTAIGKTYGSTQQLRGRISEEVLKTLRPVQPQPVQVAAGCVGKKCSCKPGQCADLDEDATVVWVKPEPVAQGKDIRVSDGMPRLLNLIKPEDRPALHEQLAEIRRRQRPSRELLDTIVGSRTPGKPDEFTQCGIVGPSE